MLARLQQHRLTGAEPEAVHLAVGRLHLAVTVQQYRGVPEQARLVALDHRAGVHRGTDLPRGLGDGFDSGPVDRLGTLRPLAVGEPARRPELGQHDEVGALLLADDAGDAVDARRDGFVVAVTELHQMDLHAVQPMTRGRR